MQIYRRSNHLIRNETRIIFTVFITLNEINNTAFEPTLVNVDHLPFYGQGGDNGPFRKFQQIRSRSARIQPRYWPAHKQIRSYERRWTRWKQLKRKKLIVRVSSYLLHCLRQSFISFLHSRLACRHRWKVHDHLESGLWLWKHRHHR